MTGPRTLVSGGGGIGGDDSGESMGEGEDRGTGYGAAVEVRVDDLEAGRKDGHTVADVIK